jgi:hypothetical protein
LPDCRLCGEELEIRWINGRLVPLHLKGRCLPYSEEARKTACWVSCRECGERCHLVQHNGGYVMLDELGPPWPKHPCFVEKFDTSVPRNFLTQLVGDLSNQDAGSTVRESTFWSDPVFLESALQWFYTTLDGVWILPVRKGNFLRVERTIDGWTLVAQLGPHRSTTMPFSTPHEAFFEAANVLTASCKDLISQMKFERRSPSQHPTRIQWDLFWAIGTDSAAFRKLSRSNAQRFLLKAFSRKYHAKAGPPSLARPTYMNGNSRVVQKRRNGDPFRMKT